MAERHNTVVCSFDLSSPRITAYDIHEWIFTELRIPEHKVQMIQTDGIKRNVHIKLVDSECVYALLREMEGQAEYKYPTGELSNVNIALAGLGTKRIRIANLPPEVSNNTLHASLVLYGKIMEIQKQKWSKAYRYCVDNGVRQITICLTRHVPSHLTIAGQQVLLSYEGQPPTCYGCGETGHMYQGCPARHKQGTVRDSLTKTTYASIVTTNTAATWEIARNSERGQIHIEDGRTLDFPMTDGCTAAVDPEIAGAQGEKPDTTETSAASAPTEEENAKATGTAQGVDIEKIQERMETAVLCVDPSIRQSGESLAPSIWSRKGGSVQPTFDEIMGSDEEGGEMTDRDDNSFFRER
jgi:hypothetical protein